jgi:TM2 domain-containing membrane protein YozV
MTDTAQGSTGNVIAALASFFIPGLGQLIQGRMLRAAFFFVAVGVLYWSIIGWPFGAVVHLWAIVDAAMYKPK